MKRGLMSLRCECGVWFRENRRGLKRHRCSKCNRSAFSASMPMLAITIAWAAKVLRRDLSDVHQPCVPRTPGVAEYGEFFRIKRAQCDKAALTRIVTRFESAIRHVAKYVAVDVNSLEFLVNTNGFYSMTYVSIAWHSFGRRYT